MATLNSNTSINQELYTKLQLLGVENERLNQVLSEVSIENSHLRSQLDKAAGTGYSDRLLELAKENQKLAAQLTEKNIEIEDLQQGGAGPHDHGLVEKLRAELQAANEQIASLESNLKLIVKENERVNLMLREKYDECEMLKKQLANNPPQEKPEDKERVKLLLSEIERLNVALNEATNENNALRRSRTPTPLSRSRIEEHQTITNKPPRAGERSSQTIPTEPQNESITGKPHARTEQTKKSGAPDEEEKSRKLESPHQKAGLTPDAYNKLNALANECEKLAGLLSERNKEVNDLRKDNEELKQAFLLVAQENESLKGNIPQIKSVSDKINTLEEKCKALIAENDKLNKLLNEKHPGAKESAEHAANAEATIAQLKKDNENLKHILEEADNEVNRLRGVVSESGNLHNHINYLQSELDKAQNELKQHQKGVVPSGGDSREDAGSLNQKLKEKIQENESLKAKLIELRNAHSRLEDIQNKALALADENDRLNMVAETMQREIDGLNKIAEQIPKLAEDNQKLQSLLQEAGKENENLKALVFKTHSTASQLPEYESKLKFLETEKQKGNDLLEVAKREISELKNQLKNISSSPKGGDSSRSEQEHRELRAQNHSLLDEIESLKDKLNHWEKEAREALNAKGRLHSLLKENEELHHELNQKNAEIERLKGTESFKILSNGSGVSDPASRAKLEELKGTIELLQGEIDRLNNVLLQRKTHDGLKEKRAGLPGESDDLNAEVGRLATLLQEKDSQIEGLRQQQGDIELLVAKFKEFEDVNNKLSQDNHSLFNELQHLQAELQARDEAIRALQTAAAKNDPNSRAKNETQQIERELSALRGRNQELEAKVSQLARDNDALRTQLGSQDRQHAEDDSNKIQKLNAEIERLSAIIQAKSKEAEEWKRQHQNLEVTRAQEIEELRVQFETYKRSNLNGNDLQVRYAAERTALETEIAQLGQIVRSQEDEIKHLKANLSLIAQDNSELIKELEELKTRMQGDDDNALKLENADLKAQIELFKSNNFDIKQLAIRYGAERAADQSQIKQLKQMNNNYREELEKVYELINQRKIEYDNLMKEFEQYKKDFSRQNQMKTSQTEDTLRHDKNRIEILQKQIADISVAKEEYKKQAEKNSEELTRKNKELIEKIQELDNLKMKYEEALNNYQHLNNQLFQKLMAGNAK